LAFPKFFWHPSKFLAGYSTAAKECIVGVLTNKMMLSQFLHIAVWVFSPLRNIGYNHTFLKIVGHWSIRSGWTARDRAADYVRLCAKTYKTKLASRELLGMALITLDSAAV